MRSTDIGSRSESASSGGENPRRSLRRGLVIAALAPLTVILGIKTGHLVGDPILNLYGIGVLLSTVAIMYVAFTAYRDPSTDSTGLLEHPLVSCLVAVKDDFETIERCVRSLVGQSYWNVEVIVVDDLSTDGTRERLRDLQQSIDFQLLELPENVGKKRALAIGAAEATGNFFIFTDSDCQLADDAVERCMLAFDAHPEIGAVSGHARALNADRNILTRIQDVWYDGQFGISKAAESVFQSVTCVSGPLAAFRREAIYNYFPAWTNDRFLGTEFKFATDRQLTGYVLGQLWIGRKLKEQNADSPFVSEIDYPERGWGVSYVRSARVWTNVPDSLNAVVRQQVRWKKSFIRNIFFTGRFYWRRSVYTSAIYYSHLLWVLCAPLLAFRHLVWLPAHGRLFLCFLYLAGVLLKGGVWAIAFRIQNPGNTRWVYRPLMSLFSALFLSWLLIYSVATLRKNIWARG